MLRINYYVRPNELTHTWDSLGYAIVHLNAPLPNVGDLVTLPKYDVAVQLDKRAFNYEAYSFTQPLEVSLYFTYDDALSTVNHAAVGNLVAFPEPYSVTVEAERVLASV